jgi:hypothetical protein
VKSRTLKCITAMTVFAALALPVQLARRPTRHKPKHHHLSSAQ